MASSLAGASTSQGIPTSGGIEKVNGTDSVRNGEKSLDTTIDRDAGKPKSVSGDVLDLSQESRDVYEARQAVKEETKAERNRQADNGAEADDLSIQSGDSDDSISLNSDAEATSESEALASDLTPEQQQQVEELKARDAEVRVHEQAHVAAGGAYVTGGPSYTYQTGPDGKKYAIGGEVGIDTSEVSGDPEATIQKMQTVARAALAPAEPSGQDYKVASAAQQKEAQARAELARQNNTAGMSGADQEEAADVAQNEVKSDAKDFHGAADSPADSSKVASQGSAYRAQSTMPLNMGSAMSAVRFSAFA